MKKIFLLLLITSQLMSSKFDHKAAFVLSKAAFVLSGACLLATGYFTYSAHNEQKKFDQEKAIDEKNKKSWKQEAQAVESYDSEKFESLYNKAKKLGFMNITQTAEEYKKNTTIAYDGFVRLYSAPNSSYTAAKRPSLLTFKNKAFTAFALAFFGFGTYKYATLFPKN